MANEKTKSLSSLSDYLEGVKNQSEHIYGQWSNVRPRIMTTWISVLIDHLQTLRKISVAEEKILSKKEANN